MDITHCFSLTLARLRCFWSVTQIGSFRGLIPEGLNRTWFPSLMECSRGKHCENVVFGSKDGRLFRNSHRICKYLIHLWTHCSLQREILSLKLCFKSCVYTEQYAVSEQIVTSNVWKLKQHMEVLEVLILPNVLTLFLCSGMLIGPTQMLSHAAPCIFPLF